MGVLTGGLSYVRYFVEGEMPHRPQETFLERMQQYVIPELTVESGEDSTLGWASAHSLLDTDLTESKVFMNQYLIASLRVDSWKIPSSLLKAYTVEETRAYKEKTGKEKLSRTEKTLLKETVKTHLKNRSLPSIASTDFCWDMEQNQVRFWTHSAKTNELFIELFEKTFNLNLVPLSPYTLAERMELEEDLLDEFEEIEQQSFSPLFQEGER
jgi:DNA recombination-dependent growth factor C